MTLAVRVHELSKSFRINRSRPREEYRTLAQSIRELVMLPIRQLRDGAALGHTEDFHALRNVSFDIHTGEVIGIIGRNGAGKSTLLKVLSEITTPTAGRVELYGRVGSLLEVGTGFHPELNGRENIFLNGSILGMSRSEILKQFDAIVEFAGVDQFLETPVKRYSSGMKVRLAFAVAAHLNPEILVIDEVLAVGDAEFQRKCLGKMSDVATSGRTVIFVSHDMTAIRNLCTRALRFERGQLIHDDEPAVVIDEYLKGVGTRDSARNLIDATVDRKGSGEAKFEYVEVGNANGEPAGTISMGEGLSFRLRMRANQDINAASIGIGLFDALGTRVAGVNCEEGAGINVRLKSGHTVQVDCLIPEMNLMPGTYRANLQLYRSTSRESLDMVVGAIEFDIIPQDVYRTGKLPNRNAIVFLHSNWKIQDSQPTSEVSGHNHDRAPGRSAVRV